MKNFLILFLLIGFSLNGSAQSVPDYTQTEVIYGRKNGMALTMFVTTPKAKNNHRGILYLASGGYYSDAKWVPETTERSAEFLKRGFTVFIVTHSSAPVYTSVEIIPDIQRAVQFVRYNAKKYDIEADKIGITGTSSGGNLSLLASTTEAKVTGSDDPVAKVSSKANAVACFYPPTDFLNYRRANNLALTDSLTQKMMREGWIASSFMFKEVNPKDNTFSFITNKEKLIEEFRKLSPIYLVDKTTAPTLLYHGDRDVLVPMYQSEIYIQKLKSLNVPCQLLVKKGEEHGWKNQENEMKFFADWFDTYLK